MMLKPTSACNETEIEVSKAAANKPHSPTKSLLSRIVAQTNASTHQYQETMDFLQKELQATSKNWRCYFNTLVVIEYLLWFGNENCVEWAMKNLYSIKALQYFSHDDDKVVFRVQYAATQVALLLSKEDISYRRNIEARGWTSAIPNINDLDPSYIPAKLPSLVIKGEPGPTEDLQKDAPIHRKDYQEPLNDTHSPFLSHKTDKSSVTMRAESIPLDTWEGSSLAEQQSQISPGAQLPDANVSPQISVAVLVPEMPHPLITNATSRVWKLADYFPLMGDTTHFTDSQCQDIARLLREGGKVSWSQAPRIYIILRLIGQLHVLDEFHNHGINDRWLPLTKSSLPPALSVSHHAEFITTQNLVLSKALRLEGKTGEHAHFTRADPFPLQSVKLLGEGRYSSVDKILSLCGREFARKRFRRGKLRKAELESFMNEVKILKRLRHTHCVAFISSYTDPKYFGIIMEPVADYDLNTFYEGVTSEKAPLLRSFFGCLAGALNFLHESKIRHRDIKPQNILVKGNDVYLTDFGISLDWENLSRSTTTEDSAKTPLYCAPEVAASGKRNTSADVWSLGCVFFEMLTLIKNRTIKELHEYFKQRTDSIRFYRNISSIQDWVEQLRQIDQSQKSDSFLADCVLDLLKESPDARPRTSELYNKLSSYQDWETGRGHPLCGDCCISDAFSVSDSGSDGDPFADLAESQ